MKLKTDPLTIIIIGALILAGSYTGGFFHGKAIESKPVYEIDVTYTEVDTEVEASIESRIENVQRSDQIVEVANYTVDGRLVYVVTNVLTNAKNLSNFTALSNSSTNYVTNMIRTELSNPDAWFDEFIEGYLRNTG